MKNRPICPECKEQTIVLFTPPRDGLVGTDEGYTLYHDKNWQEYVDWNKAHLYCCNAKTDCNYKAMIIGGNELTTP